MITIGIRIMDISIYKKSYKKPISNFGGKTMINGKYVVYHWNEGMFILVAEWKSIRFLRVIDIMDVESIKDEDVTSNISISYFIPTNSYFKATF